MIPIRDIHPRLRVPIVNYALILGCVLAFAYQVLHANEAGALVRELGFVPARFAESLAAPSVDWAHALLPLASSLFLHGGWFHVIGNLLYLHVFGDNIEDRLGHAGYLLFYFVAGAAGCLAQYAVDPSSSVPVVGASGAIAGALGAYVVLYPRQRILTLFPIFIFLTFLEVPAILFLGIWAAQQLLSGVLTIVESGAADGGVAWFAHLGGFALGAIVGVGLRIARARRKRAA